MLNEIPTMPHRKKRKISTFDVINNSKRIYENTQFSLKLTAMGEEPFFQKGFSLQIGPFTLVLLLLMYYSESDSDSKPIIKTGA